MTMDHPRSRTPIYWLGRLWFLEPQMEKLLSFANQTADDGSSHGLVLPEVMKLPEAIVRKTISFRASQYTKPITIALAAILQYAKAWKFALKMPQKIPEQKCPSKWFSASSEALDVIDMLHGKLSRVPTCNKTPGWWIPSTW